MVRAFATSVMSPDEATAIRSLLDRAFAEDEDGAFEDADWDHALGGLHVVAEADGRIVAHASVVPRILVAGDRRSGRATSRRSRPSLDARARATGPP